MGPRVVQKGGNATLAYILGAPVSLAPYPVRLDYLHQRVGDRRADLKLTKGRQHDECSSCCFCRSENQGAYFPGNRLGGISTGCKNYNFCIPTCRADIKSSGKPISEVTSLDGLEAR